MIRKLIVTLAITLSATPALACTSADVEARQGALLEAVQVLVTKNPAKANEIVLEMQAGLQTLTETGEGETVCEMMDRLTEEARSAS